MPPQIAPKDFQTLLLTLQNYWAERGCALLQGYDLEVGAGTMNPATFLHVLGPEPWNVAYVEPSRRPADGRFGENPNRLHQHHQYQVILKPAPKDVQEVYLGSLRAIGITSDDHDLRFVEDDWESPTLGAWGLGWEVWCDGMEVTQYTYFQQVGGFECDPVSVELTYGDVFLEDEREFSAYNFEAANTEKLKTHFEDAEQECHALLARKLPMPA